MQTQALRIARRAVEQSTRNNLQQLFGLKGQRACGSPPALSGPRLE
jgi:hypothetical protein